MMLHFDRQSKQVAGKWELYLLGVRFNFFLTCGDLVIKFNKNGLFWVHESCTYVKLYDGKDVFTCGLFQTRILKINKCPHFCQSESELLFHIHTLCHNLSEHKMMLQFSQDSKSPSPSNVRDRSDK